MMTMNANNDCFIYTNNTTSSGDLLLSNVINYATNGLVMIEPNRFLDLKPSDIIVFKEKIGFGELGDCWGTISKFSVCVVYHVGNYMTKLIVGTEVVSVMFYRLTTDTVVVVKSIEEAENLGGKILPPHRDYFP